MKLLLPATINPEAWAEWLDYRTNGKKKKVTDYAAKKQWKLLSMYSFEQQQQLIDQSIMNDYQGLFALKEQRHANHQQSAPRRQSAVDRVRAGCEQRERERQGHGSIVAAYD
jgi:hypothetical protein